MIVLPQVVAGKSSTLRCLSHFLVACPIRSSALRCSPDVEICILASPLGIARSMTKAHTYVQRTRTLTFLTTTKGVLAFNEYVYRYYKLCRCPMLELSSPTPQVRPSTPYLWQMHIFAATLSGIQQRQAFAMDRQCGKPRQINGQKGALSRATSLNKQGAE